MTSLCALPDLVRSMHCRSHRLRRSSQGSRRTVPSHHPHNACRPGDAAPPTLHRRAAVQWIAAGVAALLLLYGLGIVVLALNAGTGPWAGAGQVAMGVVSGLSSRSVVASRRYLMLGALVYLVIALV